MVLDIDEKKTEIIESPKNLPLRIWKIWGWDKEDKMHILYTKQIDEHAVIDFCKQKGITKYSVFITTPSTQSPIVY